MAKRLVVTGRVQGVGYRASFAEQAMALQLSGWVRNRRDGAVEALVGGDEKAVGTIIAWARRGPATARVDNIAIEDADAPVDGEFKILATV